MQVQQTWVLPREPVWVHKNQQFLKAVIKQVVKDVITCTLESGDTVRLKRADIYHRNPLPTSATRNDLMQNDIINQPQILCHLQNRFKNKNIYTYVQSTLVAVNPYYLISDLYTQQCKDGYVKNIIDNGSGIKEQEPHIYAITANMVRRLFEDGCSQAVVISGQSGAGKTQVNKQCLRFLAHYFKGINQSGSQQNSNIERAIMLSNPILQAFGNAKTIRNNNSSRFGKFLSIMIDNKTKQIKHAQIFNYLLQKSRIISRSAQQQNFHIFYQFLQKTTLAQKQSYHLLSPITKQQLTYKDFIYLQNQQLKQYISHPDINLDKIRQSLTILPDQKSFDYLCRILSAVLHLGNLEPYQDDNLDYCEIMPQEGLDVVCGLLMVQRKFLFEALTSYCIKIGGEDVVKFFSKRQVQQLIHSLSKTLYQLLFQWIIIQINSCTRSKQHEQSKLLSLGFLDIYGFEVLKTNSLEQLFINYTNQRLHQIYLHKIFKLQKEQFVLEGLQDKFKQVSFQDNIRVIQLLDFQKLSIFNLLDEECAIASPDQSTYITKIRFNHKKHQKFPPSNLNLLSTQFIIRHTPQDVQYSVMGFRDKNRDLLRQQIKMTMRSSKLRILKQMFNQKKTQNEIIDAKSHKVRKFLSSKFRKQMNELMQDLLSKSEQMFIRCIKSNGSKKPMQIEQEVVYSQIKYLGILDTIKIKKMGYCIKNKYEDVEKRFAWLVRQQSVIVPATNQQVVQSIRKFLPKYSQEEILFGKTKIFWKDYAFGVMLQKYAFYLLMLNSSAHKITNLFVKINYTRKKQRKIKNKKTLINYIRSFLQSKKISKKIKNVKKVQKSILNFLMYRSRAKKLESIQTVQAYIKRNIQSRIRQKKINLIEKVIYRFKYMLLKKKVRSRIVVDYVMDNFILGQFWKDLRKKNAQVISRYVNALKIKIMKRQYISLAIKNQRIAFEGRSLQRIQSYILSFSNAIEYKNKQKKIKKIQSVIKCFLTRKKYNKTMADIIKIQQAVRQYLFLKKGAKDLFQNAYSTYEKTLKTQLESVKSKLYQSQISQASSMTSSLRKFLGKFKQKISLLYFVIDFESFVDLEIVYPHDSWALNYCQVFQEGLQKNDPIQYVSVGQTFTIVANTTKMYLWGLHESFKNKEPDAICTVKTKYPIEYFEINKNKLNYNYVKEDESERKNQARGFKICSTVARDFNLENGRVYQCLPNQLRLLKQIPSSQRVLEISCGKSHTILRTSAKRVYTFGIGRQGQLGHSTFNSEQRPRLVKFFQNIKTSSVIQVVASFTSSLVLLSNRKLYWFGKNGTLNQVCTPTLFELKSKLQILNGTQFSIARVLSTWSRTLSLIGITLICYNKRFQNNLSLRNKTTEILISKWQQAGINNINPPLIPSVSDHLQQCHVKLRNKKINIYPESKTTLKEMQQKVKSIGSFPNGMDSATNRNSIGTQFSFANTQRNSFQR